MKRTLFALVGAISLSACAQAPDPAKAPGATASSANSVAKAPASAAPKAGTPEARAVAAIATLNPQVKADKVGAAPIPGFREAIVAGQVVYVSNDGTLPVLQGPGRAVRRRCRARTSARARWPRCARSC